MQSQFYANPLFKIIVIITCLLALPQKQKQKKERKGTEKR